MRRSKTSTQRRAGLLAVAAVLAGALAAAGARLRSRPVDGSTARSLKRFRREASSYTCTCGQRYRVSGVDRHRVYWPDKSDDPVLGSTCVRCDAPLPAGHDAPVAAA